jgi:Uma2 family endonuclease
VPVSVDGVQLTLRTSSHGRTHEDWVCEIVSPKHEKRDFVTKPQTVLAAEVPYYRLVYPEEQILLVQRWTANGYLTILSASAGQTVRAQPFDAIELRGELFGDDDEP